jgi:hypothetical protein
MGDPHVDCAYWRLTRMECVHHHVRLAKHQAARVQWHAGRARRIANVGGVITGMLAVLALALAAVSLS